MPERRAKGPWVRVGQLRGYDRQVSGGAKLSPRPRWSARPGSSNYWVAIQVARTGRKCLTQRSAENAKGGPIVRLRGAGPHGERPIVGVFACLCSAIADLTVPFRDSVTVVMTWPSWRIVDRCECRRKSAVICCRPDGECNRIVEVWLNPPREIWELSPNQDLAA